MRRRNATTLFLKECMADALIELMADKPFDKITIQEMTDRAKVGRVTYFRNFSSKHEVLTFKLLRLWTAWAQAHHLPEKGRYSLDQAKIFFAFIYSIRDLNRLIYQANLQTTIYDAFYQIMRLPANATPLERYRSRFLSYGLFGLLDEWIQRDYPEPPEELANMVIHEILQKNPLTIYSNIK